MKYAFIRRHRSVWPIGIQCGVLKVSVSGYHEHFARQPRITERRHLSEEALTVHVRAAYQEHRGAYGWPRVWRQLRAQGVRVGKQRVQRLMQQQAFVPAAGGVSGWSQQIAGAICRLLRIGWTGSFA